MVAENVCDVDKQYLMDGGLLIYHNLMGPLRASCHLGIGVNETSKPLRTLTVSPWGYIQASCAHGKKVYYNKDTHWQQITKEHYITY